MRYPRAVQVERLARHVRHRPLEVFCSAPEGGRVARVFDSASDIVVTRIPASPLARVFETLAPSRRDVVHTLDAALYWWKRAAGCIADACVPKRSDVLVTFGQPMADHLAGLRLKRDFGMIWIAHFSDPWADNPFLTSSLARRRARKLEAKVIAAADALVFTSPETVELVMSKYPGEWRRKAHVLPHAFEPALYAGQKPMGDKLTLRYLGNFYGNRGPEPLYRALLFLRERAPELFKRIRVELVGNMSSRHRQSSALARLPPETVRISPPVAYRESLSLMKSADLLLSIDAPFENSVFLPSKLVDYIGAGRPILGITPPGTAARVIRELGGWVAHPDNAEEIAAAIKTALDGAEANRGAPWGSPGVRADYAAPRVAARFESIVNSLFSAV